MLMNTKSPAAFKSPSETKTQREERRACTIAPMNTLALKCNTLEEQHDGLAQTEGELLERGETERKDVCTLCDSWGRRKKQEDRRRCCRLKDKIWTRSSSFSL